jgi:3-deoxy-D-manno-octulosonic acid (KDO) 8-phosphate synthase
MKSSILESEKNVECLLHSRPSSGIIRATALTISSCFIYTHGNPDFASSDAERMLKRVRQYAAFLSQICMCMATG